MSQEKVPSNRPLWLATILIVAVLVAAGAGFALHLAEASPVATLTGAGAAFVAAMTLGLEPHASLAVDGLPDLINLCDDKWAVDEVATALIIGNCSRRSHFA